jgi:hypothetical protein
VRSNLNKNIYYLYSHSAAWLVSSVFYLLPTAVPSTIPQEHMIGGPPGAMTHDPAAVEEHEIHHQAPL